MPGPLRWFRESHPRGGIRNMEIDRGFLQRARAGEGPWLRFYGWTPRALSLGYHQDTSVVDTVALERDGVEQVVRPTGGAAVLHAEEITYMVTAPLGGPLGPTLAGIYGPIADALAEALEQCGVGVRRGGGGRPQGPACFAATGGHELMVEGRKLVGSACRRTRDAFLVHGSILTGPGHLALPHYLRGLGESQRRAMVEDLRARTTDLAGLGLGPQRHAELCAAIARALGSRLGGALESTPPEWTD